VFSLNRGTTACKKYFYFSLPTTFAAEHSKPKTAQGLQPHTALQASACLIPVCNSL